MKARTFVAVAAVAVAAVAVWFVFLRGKAKTSSKAPPTAAHTGTGSGSGPHRDRPDTGDRGGPPGEMTVLVDDDPVGTLRLEGLVLGADDKPVAGATVAVSSNPARTTTTDTDGSFAFDKLVGRPYTLVARAPGGVGGPVTAKLTAKSDPVTIHLRAASSVKVTVLGTEQKPVANATVELRGLDDQSTQSGPDGVARFDPVAPGGYQIMARAAGFAPSFQFTQVSATPAPVELTLVLTEGARVAGRVVDSQGKPVGQARVIYSGASDWGIQADERRDGVMTGGDGRFEFAALPAGSFRFRARHPDYAPASSGIITLDGTTAKDGVEIKVDTGATVSGVVLDGGKQPVASARVRIGVATRNMIAAEPRQVFTADDGTFTVKGLPRKPLQAVALAEAGASSAVDVDASAGDVKDVKLTIDITGTIAGVVVDGAGVAIEGVQVSAAPDFRRGNFDMQSFRLRGFPQELTDAAGHFELVGLAPGTYNVRAARNPASSRRTFGMDGQKATTGDKDVKIVLPADGGVKGKVAFADGTVPSPFSVAVGFTPEPFVTKDGSFELKDLAPQKYRLSVRGPEIDEKQVEVTVEEGKTADLGTITVAKGRRISGRVTFQGQPVAGATVIAGRQIFGTGSSNNAQFGGGPPGRQNTRETTTDDDGRFTVSGLGPADIAVVAESKDGRSAAVLVERGSAEELDLELTLQGFGSLAGKLTDATGPAEDTIVTVQSVSTPNAMYSVATGADGAYRFDKLAPDIYKVSAMLGMPMRGMTFYSKQGTVFANKETRLDLEIEKGNIALSVTAKATSGDFRGGFAWLISGVVSAKDGRELSKRMAAQPGSSKLGVFMMGGPATYTDLAPGGYTLCGSALPTEAAGPQAMTYLERHGDEMPVTCKGLTLAAAPDKQTAEITLDIPPFVPD